MDRLVTRSPAKLNLFLRVLGKRGDGYHEIASLMQAINLFDDLAIESSSEDRVTCTDPELPLDDRNLVVKALRLFRSKTGVHLPVALHLTKRIPQGAGLGGGSGNAATVLWSLNRLFSTGASDAQLGEWSSEIGSDIPFFFSEGTAFCSGRGEKVSSLQVSLPSQWTLLKPQLHGATASVYGAFDLSLASREVPEALLDKWRQGRRVYLNDLFDPACRCCPGLREVADQLQGWSFTGSGSCFYTEEALDVRPSFPHHLWQVGPIARKPGHWY